MQGLTKRPPAPPGNSPLAPPASIGGSARPPARSPAPQAPVPGSAPPQRACKAPQWPAPDQYAIRSFQYARRVEMINQGYQQQTKCALFNSVTEVQPVPTDTVTSLKFCPVADILALSSWDGKIHLHRFQQNQQNRMIQCTPHMEHTRSASVLDLNWMPNSSNLVFCGRENGAFILDPQTNQTQQIAQHQLPVSRCYPNAEKGIVGTSSWDRTIAFWDTRNPKPVAIMQHPNLLQFHTVGDLVAVAGGSEVLLYDLRNLSQPAKFWGDVETVSEVKIVPPQRIGTVTTKLQIYATTNGGHFTIMSEANEFSGKNFKNYRANNHWMGPRCECFGIRGMITLSGLPLIILYGDDGGLTIWDLKTSTDLFDKKANPLMCQGISAADVSPSKKILAYASSYTYWRGDFGQRNMGHIHVQLKSVGFLGDPSRGIKFDYK